ncbi:MAG TPA: class I SAM-dependent methyltransferase [Solirubrobacteraceae bacterium]|nr:class I SAM-dependent methyltransferase [Solirubrobacteraceae bacterium]
MAVAASARKRTSLELFRELSPQYDWITPVMSFGQDPRWRRAVVDAVAPAATGGEALDVATGTGLIAAELLERGARRVLALDQSAEMLTAARARFDPRPEFADRVDVVLGEAERLPYDDARFDAVTFAYLLRYVDDPAATLRELARVVRPGGRIAGFEFGVPPRPRLRRAWRLYTVVGMPLLGRAVSPAWGRAGAFLGPSIVDFERRHPLRAVVGYWEQAGLCDVVVRRMSFGAGVVISATRS